MNERPSPKKPVVVPFVADEKKSNAMQFKEQWESEQQKKDVDDYASKQVIQAKVKNINASLMIRLKKVKE